MVLDEKRDKLDAKGIKCMFLKYCKGTNTYRLMCLEAKKIIKSRDVVFMKDSGSIKNDLEMHPSGRNEGPKVVVVDKSSKSPLFDGSGQYVDGNEQVGGNGNDIEESHEGPANDHVIVEGFGKERRPLGEW